MKMTIPTDLLIGAYTPLTPSRHLNIPREKHLTEFFYHRRKGSLPSDIRSSLRNIQSSQNNNLIHLKYGKILKKGSHKNSNTDKNLTSVSINMKQIKVPGTKDLHGRDKALHATFIFFRMDTSPVSFHHVP